MGNTNHPKEPLTIAIDPDVREAIQAARKRLARGGEEPSAGSVVRQCLTIALPMLGVTPAPGIDS